MSETPRTDAVQDELINQDTYTSWLEMSQTARQLERELNAANERIKQLEAVVNDPEVLWSNWLRGDVKLPAGIGDVRQYQDRIKRLENAGDMMVQHFYTDEPRSVMWEKAKEDKP